MSDLAKQLIEKEKRERTGKLDLGYCGLTDLEKQVPGLFDLAWLEELTLSNSWWDEKNREWIESENKSHENQIAAIPPAFANLQFLKILRISGDENRWQISNIRFLENLTGLHSLNLSRNQINEIRFLEKLTELQSLDLSGNQIINIRFLENLTGLQSLDLSYNQIINIRFLEKLVKLNSLDLSNNQISNIRFLEKLTKLQSLGLSSNPINDPGFLDKLTGLTSLYLGNNHISNIHFLKKLTGLQTLDLSDNQISNIRPLEKLTKLKSLNLKGNKLAGFFVLEKLTGQVSHGFHTIKISNILSLEKLTGLTSLDLSNNQISDVLSLEKLTGLTSLDLSNNQISDVFSLEKLTGLTSLDLSNNQISDVFSLEKLTGLTSLDLSNNQISDVLSLGKLTGLQSLDLSNNQISDVFSLEKLTGLTSLDLSNNQISDVLSLEKLTGLQSLNLSSNQISDFLSLEKLMGLQSLNLSSNQISDYGFLEKLTGLTSLYLISNQINDIRFLEKLTGLTSLYLSSNQISDITALLHLIEKGVPLTMDLFEGGINLWDNPITMPPLEIVEKGNKAVLRYFKRLGKAVEANRKVRLYEAKVLLVGKTGAGKTSLRHKLRHPDTPLPEGEESTHGVDVETLHFTGPQGEHCRMNLWDFEGQQISLQTHQFFLTHRSYYVMVVDQRTEKADFDNWLQTVELHGGNSPLLFFHNEQQGRTCGINLDGIRQRFGHFLRPNEHRANLKYVGNGNAHDIEQLKLFQTFEKHLQSELMGHSLVGIEVDRSWLEVREAIEALAKERNHISLEELQTICTSKGVTEQIDVTDLSQLFHDLGIYLHYADPDYATLLSRIIILRREWATKAVYDVLKSKWLKEKKLGVFDLSDLRKVWASKDYGQHAPELLELMKKFELCYQVEGSKYHIAPQLLPPEPASDYKFPDAETLLLRYEYDFMPKGIITNLTVRMHKDIAREQRLAWQDGFVLERHGATVEVKLAYGRDLLMVRATGELRRKLLNEVAFVIDKLHDGYHWTEQMDVHKMLPCKCEVCADMDEPLHFFKHKEVKVQQAKGWDKLPCGKTGNPSKVSDILVDVLEGDEEDFFDRRHLKRELFHLKQGQQKLLDNDAVTHKKLDELDSKINERFGALLQALEKDIDNHKGNFFKEGSDEEKQFYDKIDALIAKHHINEVPKDWHDLPPKSKLKIALKVPFIDLVGVDIRHEWEMDTSNAKRPKTWKEFKRWFLKPEEDKG